VPAQEKALRTPTPDNRIPAGRLSPPSTPAVADVGGHRADVTQFQWQTLHNRSARTHTPALAARNDRRDARRSSEVHRSAATDPPWTAIGAGR